MGKSRKFVVHAKPISVNRAWEGRRFSTPEKKQFEMHMALILPKIKFSGPYYRVHYKFYLVNWAITDYSNCIKVFEDCLVRKGIITDDRRIVKATIEKFRAKKDRIEVLIENVSVRELESGQP